MSPRKITPFSNGTEAMIWLEHNCEVCKTKSGCSARHNIELGFISGEITLSAANKIGYEDEELYFNCQMRDRRKIKKYKKLDTSNMLLL